MRCAALGFLEIQCQIRGMKSLQSFIIAGSLLLTATVASAQFGAATPPPSLLGPKAGTTPEVQALVQEGLAAFQKGDLDKAKSAFELAYTMDPRNVMAISYLRRIQAAEKTRPAKVDRERLLSGVIIPNIQFKDATLGSALDFLKKAVNQQSAGRQSVSFVVQMPAEQVNTMTVSLSLQNIPASEAIRYLADVANATVTYETYAVVFKPKATAVTPGAPAVPGTVIPQSAPQEVVGLNQ
jgi:hypothetical protein